MTGLDDDPVHGLDDLEEDPRETARKQIQFLEEGLDPSVTGAAASALLDEAYRGAHLLRSALDPSRSPNVIRIARQIQALVTAVRKGHIPPGPGVFSLLRTAAHAAADSVEAVLRGKREADSSREAAAALEAFLGGAFAAPPLAQEGAGAARYTRVVVGRLDAARAAAGSLAAASAAFVRSAEEAVRAEETLRSHVSRRAQLASEVLAAIPQGLAAAARGEPVTVIAQELAGRISALAALDAESGDAIARLTARIREAGDAGSRAADGGSAALAGVAGVSLPTALSGIEAAARGVDVRVELGDGEIEASRGPLVKTALMQAIRALLEPARARKSGPARSAKGRAAVKQGVSVEADSKDGREILRVVCSGSPVRADELARRLVPHFPESQPSEGGLAGGEAQG